MFNDRQDAGRQLCSALIKYRDTEALVLAIPRGGVEVGYYVAEKLDIQLTTIIIRKLPLPYNPEAGFGAVAEDGSTFFTERARHQIPPEVQKEIIEGQKREIERRIEVLRARKPLPEIQGRTVILVDDGIAMGSTMQAAIILCKNKKADKIIVACPVAAPYMKEHLKEKVDEVIILETPAFFRAVAEVYRNWYDVSDDEVNHILHKSRK